MKIEHSALSKSLSNSLSNCLSNRLINSLRKCLSNNIFDHMPMNIGQTEIAPLISISKLSMINAK